MCVSSREKQCDVIAPPLPPPPPPPPPPTHTHTHTHTQHFVLYYLATATIKDLNCGVTIDFMKVSILLCADDIALISPDEESLQKMLLLNGAGSRGCLLTVIKHKLSTSDSIAQTSRNTYLNLEEMFGKQYKIINIWELYWMNIWT